MLDEEVNRSARQISRPFRPVPFGGTQQPGNCLRAGLLPGTVESRYAGPQTPPVSLSRRGVDSGAGLVALLAQEKAVAACLPRLLVFSTTKAALAPAASKAAAAGLISYQVAVLTQGVLRTMLISKLKMIGGMVMPGSYCRRVRGWQLFVPGWGTNRGQRKVCTAAGCPRPILDRIKLLGGPTRQRQICRPRKSHQGAGRDGALPELLAKPAKGRSLTQAPGGDFGSEIEGRNKKPTADAKACAFSLCGHAPF